jgi:DNA-binding NtrC family response regulator
MMHGRFRQDLYYRLNVISIRIPPLRERREDIRLLFHHFLRSNDAFRENDRDCLAPKYMGHLEAYDWPGNVRELQNVAESMLLAARGGRLSDMELPSGTLAAKLLHRETPVQKSMPAQEDGEGKSIWDARQAGKQQQETGNAPGSWNCCSFITEISAGSLGKWGCPAPPFTKK